MSEHVAATIRAAIQDHGPIAFSEYMDLALYGPDGYYARPPVGPGGDFVTSPHIHPVFGSLVAHALRELQDTLARPTPFLVTEVGAGDGTLAQQLLNELSDQDVAYTAVETSLGARATLRALDGVCVSGELPGEAHVVLANELLDNLPFNRVRHDREIRIGVAGDRFVEVDTTSGPRPPSEDGDEGEEIVPVGAFAFLDRLAETLSPGYALLIDYGGVGSAGGDIHGYRNHRVVEDVLADPGSSDITVGVDFALLARHAEECGLVAFPSVTQHDALLALGFEAWLREELERQTELLDARDGLEAVRAWSGRSRATLLVDPSALGRLRWLLLASPGLPSPPWLDAALHAD